MIFIFLSFREKAHDNKEFSHENSKPRRESRPVKSNPGNTELNFVRFYKILSETIKFGTCSGVKFKISWNPMIMA